MKNIIIVILIIVVGGLGYLQFVKNDTPGTDKESSPSNSDTTTTKQPASGSGKTIDLSGKGLTQINDDILDDNSVTALDVSRNNLTGALPAEIRKLVNLEVLNASENKMTGIPAEVGQLSKLKIANFANNNLSGLPLEIGNLKSLDALDLRGNPNVSKQDLSQIQSKIPNAKILVD